MPKRAQELRKILGSLGPSFAKVGQALSARPDLMPPVYLQELGQLQDQLPPFPTPIAMALIEEELGCKVRPAHLSNGQSWVRIQDWEAGNGTHLQAVVSLNAYLQPGNVNVYIRRQLPKRSMPGIVAARA